MKDEVEERGGQMAGFESLVEELPELQTLDCVRYAASLQRLVEGGAEL